LRLPFLPLSEWLLAITLLQLVHSETLQFNLASSYYNFLLLIPKIMSSVLPINVLTLLLCCILHAGPVNHPKEVY